MSFLGKEYKFHSEENFDGFLRSMGLPDDKIQALQAFKPSQTMVQDGDTYTITITTPEGNKNVSFQSGVEIDDVIGLGDIVKSTYVVEGNTVTHIAKNDQGTATFKKEYNGDDLVVTITSSSWDGVAKRFYKA